MDGITLVLGLFLRDANHKTFYRTIRSLPCADIVSWVPQGLEIWRIAKMFWPCRFRVMVIFLPVSLSAVAMPVPYQSSQGFPPCQVSICTKGNIILKDTGDFCSSKGPGSLHDPRSFAVNSMLGGPSRPPGH